MPDNTYGSNLNHNSNKIKFYKISSTRKIKGASHSYTIVKIRYQIGTNLLFSHSIYR